MKCISLWQPWATLLAHGKKRVETRSWATRHRGPVLIHASKKWNQQLADLCRQPPFRSTIAEIGRAFEFEFGALLGIANIHDCRQAAEWSPQVSDVERAFGDYSVGRFCWLMDGFRPFAVPIPYRGFQGLFDVPADVFGAAA